MDRQHEPAFVTASNLFISSREKERLPPSREPPATVAKQSRWGTSVEVGLAALAAVRRASGTEEKLQARVASRSRCWPSTCDCKRIAFEHLERDLLRKQNITQR